jgi:large subunit ribosomal protein L19
METSTSGVTNGRTSPRLVENKKIIVGGFKMNVLDKINKEQVRDDIADFNVGDTVKVYSKIVEGKTERVQMFQGTVIAKKGSGVQEAFTVRRVISGLGVERVYPVNSPRLVKIEVTRKGLVRRSKLYYLRDKIGKAARVKERRFN